MRMKGKKMPGAAVRSDQSDQQSSAPNCSEREGTPMMLEEDESQNQTLPQPMFSFPQSQARALTNDSPCPGSLLTPSEMEVMKNELFWKSFVSGTQTAVKDEPSTSQVNNVSVKIMNHFSIPSASDQNQTIPMSSASVNFISAFTSLKNSLDGISSKAPTPLANQPRFPPPLLNSPGGSTQTGSGSVSDPGDLQPSFTMPLFNRPLDLETIANESMLRGIVQAFPALQLSSKELEMSLAHSRPPPTPPELWKALMSNFENGVGMGLAYVKSLPGIDKVKEPDRSQIFSDSFLPMAAAQQLIDAPSTNDNFFLNMTKEMRDLFLSYFPAYSVSLTFIHGHKYMFFTFLFSPLLGTCLRDTGNWRCTIKLEPLVY